MIFTKTSKTSYKAENVQYIGDIQFMNGTWRFIPNHDLVWMATGDDLIAVGKHIESLNSNADYTRELLADRVSFLTSLVIRATVEGWSETQVMAELDK
jgi:hypothetical protein